MNWRTTKVNHVSLNSIEYPRLPEESTRIDYDLRFYIAVTTLYLHSQSQSGR